MTSTPSEILLSTDSNTRARGGVRASMCLDFAYDAVSKVTYLARSFQEAPLKVVRAFTLADGTALAHLHNVSGGLLGGDQITLQVNVGQRAGVQLTTTGATRIYRHRGGISATTQRNEVVVGEDAVLEYLPDATIPFAGANFRQNTAIDLAPGAGLFWWEIVSPGREARGELFAYAHFETRISVTACGRRIAVENICLRPASRDISSPARFGAYRYAATFYICREGREAGSWRSSENHIRELTSELTRQGEILWGVSSLVAHGLVVRCLAKSSREVLAGLHSIWRRAKLHLYDREAIAPRKVN